jgi:hypothetical protein
MLTIRVQDQLHRTVRELHDDPDNSFLEYCRAAARNGKRFMDAVDPYADSMWNYIQLDAVAADMHEALSRGALPGSQTHVVTDALGAVREARSLSGYVLIVGG